MNPVERSSGGVVERLPSAEDARLRKTALQLEGLFVQRMFAAMRETVPQDGAMAASSAESTFSSLLDEKLAEQVPSQWNGTHSLAEALYRQLRQRIDPPPPPPSDTQVQSTVPASHRATVPPHQGQ
jgi:flagellar protein FlgJ